MVLQKGVSVLLAETLCDVEERWGVETSLTHYHQHQQPPRAAVHPQHSLKFRRTLRSVGPRLACYLLGLAWQSTIRIPYLYVFWCLVLEEEYPFINASRTDERP